MTTSSDGRSQPRVMLRAAPYPRVSGRRGSDFIKTSVHLTPTTRNSAAQRLERYQNLSASALCPSRESRCGLPAPRSPFRRPFQAKRQGANGNASPDMVSTDCLQLPLAANFEGGGSVSI